MGGAPPHRTWHVSDTWKVKVQDDMTVAQLLELVKEVTHRQDLNVQSLNLRNETGAWHPDAANSAQTVKEAGLTQVKYFHREKTEF